MHSQLGLRIDAGSTDINLGCSGYIYALGLAKGLIESGQVSTVLVVTADTYSKFLNPGDKSVRTIFGDGASATLVTGEGDADSLSAFTYGTDGSGGKHLVVPRGGLRSAVDYTPRLLRKPAGLNLDYTDLFMDGAEIFNFTIKVAPTSVAAILKKSGLTMDDIDLFVFHQANKYMLGHLRAKLEIPESKFPILMANSGNTAEQFQSLSLTPRVKAFFALECGCCCLASELVSWGGAVVNW